MQIEKITTEELASLAKANGITLPIEQTNLWEKYQATIPGRKPWGCVAFKDGDKVVAVASFIDYETHGYHYIRTTHGPAWASTPTEDEEVEALKALQKFVKAEDKNVAFVRICVLSNPSIVEPVLSTVQYDKTVIVDITGTEEEILSRFKSRGRRDTRKALRESPAVVADETDKATESFAEYYEVMEETGARDGFKPAPISDFEDMIKILGPEHCRVYASRVDGQVVAWSIQTINDGVAVYYYGASRSGTGRLHAVEKMKLFEFVDLGQNHGCKVCDMMGIGSELAPSLNGLNEFKCKFANDITDVAPGRDLPIKTAFYKALQLAKKVKG